MSAFAAILARGDARVESLDLARVAQALASVYGTPPASAATGECALLFAPRDSTGRLTPVITAETGITVVGQAVIEDATSLAASLGLPRGADDLEIVAAAYAKWGRHCTRHLSGEFALAIWDPRERLLIGARDGLGIRLLYAAQGPNLIVLTNVLASARCLPGIPGTLDDEALISFVADGVAGSGRTPFKAVRQVPAGHTLCLRHGGPATLSRHWWFPQPERPQRSMRARDAIDGYRAVLQQAVGERLHTSRASLFLSGGVDSTTIAAAARLSAPQVALHAFTAVYPRLPAHDEIAFARLAATRLSIPSTSVDADVCDVLDAQRSGSPALELLDEPTLTDWRGLVGIASRHARVGLYGEDGDSLFRPPGARGLAEESGIFRTALDSVRFAIATRRLPYLGLRLRERIARSRSRPADLRAPFLSAQARTILAARPPADIFGLAATPLSPHPTRPQTQDRLTIGAGELLAPLIAPDATRRPMEIRCPLLDSRVIRFVMSVPAIPWCQQKRLPREAFRGELDAAVLDRPKTPVSGLDVILLRAWQRAHARYARITHDALATWIDAPRWQAALQGADTFQAALAWRVLQLDSWLEHHGRAAEVPAAGVLLSGHPGQPCIR